MESNNAYTLEQLSLLPIEDILQAPQKYADPNFDLPLAKVTTKGLEDNPTLIMLGVDLKGKKTGYYLVIEDNDMSEDRYSPRPDGSDLVEMYNTAIQNILDADQEWLKSRA